MATAVLHLSLSLHQSYSSPVSVSRAFSPSLSCLKFNYKRRPQQHRLASSKKEQCEEGTVQRISIAESEGKEMEKKEGSEESFLYSVSPLPLMFLGILPGGEAVRSLLGPFVELVKTWNLPDWLIHWGHPGNMAVVLFAMGGYGTYLGFRIKFSDDVVEKAKAKDLHPKLLGGMFFFFALGATGGITSLLTSDKSIFESSHAVTGFIGLLLLTIQAILPSFFEENADLRNVHGLLGTGIMTLFFIHAALGLQLGLSY